MLNKALLITKTLYYDQMNKILSITKDIANGTISATKEISKFYAYGTLNLADKFNFSATPYAPIYNPKLWNDVGNEYIFTQEVEEHFKNKYPEIVNAYLSIYEQDNFLERISVHLSFATHREIASDHHIKKDELENYTIT